ncbi:MFS transporter [Chloroflexota bacterium]
MCSFISMTIWGGLLPVYGVFFKPMSTELGWTRATTSGAYSWMYLLAGFLAILAGKLSDKFGPRLLIMVCGLLMGLGYVLMSQVNTIWQLYLFYGVIVGIGVGGTAHPTVMSTMARWFVRRRGLVTGIVQAGMGIGAIIILPLTARLISTQGWRTCYIILGIMALVIFILVGQFLRRDPAQMRQVPYGAGEAKIESLVSEARWVCLTKAIRNGQFWMISGIWFCSMFSMVIIGVHIIPHATDLGISPVNAANILAIRAGANIIGNIAIGVAGDKIGTKPALIISFILRTTALFWLLIIKEVWMFYQFALIIGFFAAGSGALMYPIVAELFGLGELGVIIGSVQYAGVVGGAMSTTLGGMIFDHTGSYQLGFLICAAFSFIGLILACFLRLPVKEGQ